MSAESHVNWSVQDRRLLSAKITLRRMELGLTVESFAARLGRAPSIVESWEEEAPRRAEDDAKWEAALEVEPGWLRMPLDREALTSARLAIFDLQGMVPPECCLRARREFLGMSLDELSTRTSIPSDVLADFENSLPAWSRYDAIIESALFLPPGVVRHGAAKHDITCRVADDMQEIFEFLETQQRPATRGKTRGIRAQVAFRRYGALGDEQRKFHVIGDAFGVTGQAAFKIVADCQKAAARSDFSSSAFNLLASMLEPMLPGTVDALTEHFRPFLGARLSLKSANRFASDFLDGPLFYEKAGIALPAPDASEATGPKSPKTIRRKRKRAVANESNGKPLVLSVQSTPALLKPLRG